MLIKSIEIKNFRCFHHTHAKDFARILREKEINKAGHLERLIKNGPYSTRRNSSISNKCELFQNLINFNAVPAQKNPLEMCSNMGGKTTINSVTDENIFLE